MSHGYEAKAVTRMGSIHRDANNAAAAAYRSSEVRTVAGDASTSGAVIVPLMTSDGCVGVLSAEMRAGAEKDESAQALADDLRLAARDARRDAAQRRTRQARHPGVAVRIRVVTVYEQ